MGNNASTRFNIYMFIALLCPLLILIVFGIITFIFIYKRNVKRLNAVPYSYKIAPQKIRFILSWLSYGMIPCLIFILPYSIILWLLLRDTSNVYISSASFVFAMLFTYLFLSPSAYPYYVLAISAEKMNGGTKWGWLWKRTEIRLDEINTEKLAQKQLVNKLGIRIIYSINGAKIMTLGLSEEQLSEIIMLANNASTDDHEEKMKV